MDNLEYKGYKGSVEYSKEDNCLFGKVQGMSKALILYEGQTLDELRKDFEDGIDSYIEGCKTIWCIFATDKMKQTDAECENK